MYVVLTTTPKGQGRALAKKLVEGRYCACVNVLPGVHSTYRWEDEVQTAEEETLICKVDDKDVGILASAIKEGHPYDTPEVVALVVDDEASDNDYVRWVTWAVR